MRLLIVTSTFPLHTFIFRKVLTLAAHGHMVTVATRTLGNWQQFKKHLPLPSTIKVKPLLPDTRLNDPRRLFTLITTLPHLMTSGGARSRTLWSQCRTDSRTQNEPIRHFVRHLPFLSLRTDIVHFEFLGLSGTYPLVHNLLNVPRVVSCRGVDLHLLEQQPPKAQKIQIEALQTVNAVHAVSDEMAQAVKRISGRIHDIWINRPAIDESAIVPKQSTPPQETHNSTPLITCVGRLVWKKGYDYLLAALSRLNQQGHPFRVQIIGGGELQSVLRFSIEDMGLSSQVELRGFVPPDKVLEMLQRSDLFVLSSHEEGISNAALEAMACGLPVVTTNAGGMAEAVRDGIDGFVVPVRDITAMTNRIARLLADPALREQMGRSARARVEAEFSLERQARVFEEMYASVVKKA